METSVPFRRLTLAATFLAVLFSAPANAGFADRPGDFDYYAMVLSWSPSFCLDNNGAHANEQQCTASRPYAFVLHGLWPQFNKGWPESCDIGQRPWVPKPLINSMLDIMPSEKLVIHEYAKHGTCSGLDAQGYFGLARKLFAKVTVPPKYMGLGKELNESVDQLITDFKSANPAIAPGGIAVDCSRGGRIREVHICFTKDGAFTRCGKNEDQNRICRSASISIPPVRGDGTNSRTMVDSTDAKGNTLSESLRKWLYRKGIGR